MTAYTALLQTICSLLEGEDVQKAPQLLYEAIQCFVKDLSKLTFQNTEGKKVNFEEKKKEVEEQFFPRETRKKLPWYLRAIQKTENATNIEVIENSEFKKALIFLSAFKKTSASSSSASSASSAPTVEKEQYGLNVDLLKEAIKRGNQVLFAQFSVQVGEELIRKYNQQSTAAFPKLSIHKGKDTQEGNRIKNAITQGLSRGESCVIQKN